MAMEGGVAELLMDSPLCEEETLIILSSMDRQVGERSTMRSTPGQHRPPQLPGSAVENFKRRAVLGPQTYASGPAELCQERFRITRASPQPAQVRLMRPQGRYPLGARDGDVNAVAGLSGDPAAHT